MTPALPIPQKSEPHVQNDVQSREPAPHGTDGAHSLTATFVKAYQAAGGKAVIDLAALQSAVCAFVRSAKERGDPPQRVIVALKALTMQVVDWRQASPQQQALREAVIRLCLDEFYGPASSHQKPPRAD